MIFEVLCVDVNDTVMQKSTNTLMRFFETVSVPFEGATFDYKQGTVTTANGITVKVEAIQTGKVAFDKNGYTAFRLTSEMTLSKPLDPALPTPLEAFRLDLLTLLRKKMRFSNVRVLRDELSKEIACCLYPKIYDLETKVRSFIVQNFLLKFGLTDWPDLAISKPVRDEYKGHKGNERLFVLPGLVDADVILLDFLELGKIIYGDIAPAYLPGGAGDAKRILDGIFTAIRAGSGEKTIARDIADGNYQKYFRHYEPCYDKDSLRKAWETLYRYRNNVAHNSHLSAGEYVDCVRLCDKVGAMIDCALSKLATLNITESDAEGILASEDQAAVAESGNASVDLSAQTVISQIGTSSFRPSVVSPPMTLHQSYQSISERRMLQELSEATRRLEFVPRGYFVTRWLGSKDFDYKDSYALLDALESVGYVAYAEKAREGSLFKTVSVTLTESGIKRLDALVLDEARQLDASPGDRQDANRPPVEASSPPGAPMRRQCTAMLDQGL